MTIKGILSNILGGKKSGATGSHDDDPIPFQSASTAPKAAAPKPEFGVTSSPAASNIAHAKFNPTELNQYPTYKQIQQTIHNMIGMITPSADLDLVALQIERRQAMNNIVDQWIDVGFPPLDEGSAVYQQLMPTIKAGKDEHKVRYGDYVHMYHDIATSTRESEPIKNLVNWILILKNFAAKNPTAYMSMIQEMYTSGDAERKKLATVLTIIVESPIVNEMIEYPGRVREQPFRDVLENAFRQLYQLTAKTL